MNLSLMPDYIYQQFAANGKMLSGGTIYFYQSGTLTPQTVFADAAGTTPLGTSVTLSASGTAVIFLGPGAYRIWIKDANGVQVAPWVDGISSGGFSGVPGTNASVAFVQNYGDVRALTSNPDLVYVAGTLAEGDGGQGWFQMIPGSSLSDDNGIVLVASASSGPYTRLFDGMIDPEWYGYQYNTTTDQTAAFVLAIAASVRWGMDLEFSQPSTLNQNTTVSAGAGIRCTTAAYFHGTTPVTMTFSTGSKFTANGTSFGDNVQPIFGAGVCPQILLSWMGGSTDDVRMSKLAGCTTQYYKALLDVSTSLTLDPSFPVNLAVDASAGAVGTYTATSNLTIRNLAYSGMGAIFSFPSLANVGTVTIPNQVKPEWFGAKGDGTTDDSIALKAACSAGNVWLTQKYLNSVAWSITTGVTLNGSLPNPLQVAPTESTALLSVASGITISMGSGSLTANGVEISGVSTGAAIACGLFNATGAAVSNVAITSTGGIVRNSLFPGSGNFPVSLLDIVDGCTTATNSTINLSQYGKARWNTLGGSGPAFWHFTATAANSILTFANNSTTWHLVHLNSTSTANVDAFAGDVVNSSASTPAAAQSVLLSIGIGTVNLLQLPAQTGQLWNSVGGMPTAGVALMAVTPILTAAWPGSNWSLVSGAAPTSDGTRLLPANGSAFHWTYLESPVSTTYYLSPLALLAGVIKLAVTTPVGAASGGVLQLKLDLTGSSGGAWQANKQIEIPASSSSETFVVTLPLLGGFWGSTLYTGANQEYSAQLDLIGSGLNGYKIEIQTIQEIPQDQAQSKLWSSITGGVISGTYTRCLTITDAQAGCLTVDGNFTLAQIGTDCPSLPGVPWTTTNAGVPNGSWFPNVNFMIDLNCKAWQPNAGGGGRTAKNYITNYSPANAISYSEFCAITSTGLVFY
jgi:hypothetical protein